MSVNARISRLAPPTSAPSTSGSSDQLVDVVGLHAAAVDDVAQVTAAPPNQRTQARPDVRMRVAGLLRGRLRPVPIAHTGS